MEIPGGMPMQAGQVSAADESILTDEEGHSVSVDLFSPKVHRGGHTRLN